MNEKPKIPLKATAYSSQISLSHRNKNKSTFIVQNVINQTSGSKSLLDRSVFAGSSQNSTQRDFLKHEVPSMTSNVLSDMMTEIRAKQGEAR